MKKEFKKRLNLSKQTISKLNVNDLSNVKGGVRWTGCDSACTECPTNPTTTITKMTLIKDQL